MVEQTNHIVAAVSQLEVDNFPFAFPKYSAGFRSESSNNEVVYNRRYAVTLSISQTLLSTNSYAPRIASSCRIATFCAGRYGFHCRLVYILCISVYSHYLHYFISP